VVYLEPNEGMARGILSRAAFNVLYDLSFPWTLIVSLIISLYWHKTLQQFDKNLISLTVKLDKLTIPFLILSVALVSLDAIGFILRVNWVEVGFQSLRTVNGVFWILSMVCIGILFIYSGTKILRHLWNHNSAAHEKLKLMTQKVIACAFGMFVFTIGMAMSSDAPLFDIGSFFVFGGLNIMSLTQIMIFQSPASPGRNGTSSFTNGPSGNASGVANSTKSYSDSPDSLNIPIDIDP